MCVQVTSLVLHKSILGARKCIIPDVRGREPHGQDDYEVVN